MADEGLNQTGDGSTAVNPDVPTWSATHTGPVIGDPPTAGVARTEPGPAADEPGGGSTADRRPEQFEFADRDTGVRLRDHDEDRYPDRDDARTEDREHAGRRLRTGAVVGAVVALVALGGLGGWLIGRGSGSSTDTTGEVVQSAAVDPTATTSDSGGTDDESGTGAEAGATEAGAGEDPASPSTTAPATEEDEVVLSSLTTPDGPFVVPSTPDNPAGATQYAVMTGGRAVMRGWYPTTEYAAAAVADAAEIMGGTDNVVDETVLEPRAELDPDGFAVYFEDYILFESDSAEITPDFFELLGYPLFFLLNNPNASVTVVARTDARGTADYNLELAERRAEAVRDHWLANGADAAKIVLDPRGEEGADEDADDDEARLDRRVELIVSGFLSPE